MTRLLSGVVLGGAALAAILLLPPLGVRILAAIIAALAAREYLHVLQQDTQRVRAIPIMVLAVATCWLMSSPNLDLVLPLLLLGLVWLAVEVVSRGFTVDRAAARFLAMWYIGMPLGMLVAVQSLAGRMATLLFVATVVVSDSAQFYAGRLFGRRPLAPTISPKKTVEGALGGLVLATLFIVLVGPSVLPRATVLSLVILGLAIVLLGICGDLFESRLKRIAGIKDSSGLIPGHGGVLDRIDALLFATPAFYLYIHA